MEKNGNFLQKMEAFYGKWNIITLIKIRQWFKLTVTLRHYNHFQMYKPVSIHGLGPIKSYYDFVHKLNRIFKGYGST